MQPVLLSLVLVPTTTILCMQMRWKDWAGPMFKS